MNIVDIDVDVDSVGEHAKSKDDAMICKINMACDVNLMRNCMYRGVKMENEEVQVWALVNIGVNTSQVYVGTWKANEAMKK